MAADAAAPWSNASGTIGAAPAIEQSKWKSPNDISQQYDQSVGQGNATQHQWTYGDNDHQYRETQRIQNPGSETFNDKIGKPDCFKTSEDATEATKPVGRTKYHTARDETRGF